MRRVAAAMAMTDRSDAIVPVAALVNCGGCGAVVVVLLPAVTFVLGAGAKFAQVMRVALAKWTTIERLPMKEAWPGTIEAYGSSYEAVKGSEVIFPYLPERSPTWQVCGRVGSQGVESPRWNGSRWDEALRQFPVELTCATWI
jgi:hypothetical protein